MDEQEHQSELPPGATGEGAAGGAGPLPGADATSDALQSAEDSVEAALGQAQSSLEEIAQAADVGGDGIVADGFFDDVPAGIELLSDVNLDVMIELGRTEMLLEDVLKLGSGSVVELDKLAGDPVDVYVNNRLIARGEVLVLNDQFCIRVSEIVDDLSEHADAVAQQATM